MPAESKILVKKNRVTVKLKKVKGEYSYDHWSDLKKKGGKAAKEKEKGRDPSAGIMDMMKDLYDNGDDNMRKIIGESMMKSQRGEKMDPKDVGPGEDDLGAKEGDLDVDADDLARLFDCLFVLLALRDHLVSLFESEGFLMHEISGTAN